MNHTQLLTELMYAFFHFAYCFSRRFSISADIVAQLFLIDTRYPFQAGKRKGKGKFLQKRRDVIAEHELYFFKLFARFQKRFFNLLVGNHKIFFCFGNSIPCPYDTIRQIVCSVAVDRKGVIRTCFNDGRYFFHMVTPDNLLISLTVPFFASFAS